MPHLRRVKEKNTRLSVVKRGALQKDGPTLSEGILRNKISSQYTLIRILRHYQI